MKKYYLKKAGLVMSVDEFAAKISNENGKPSINKIVEFLTQVGVINA
jgi:hypothetical protein